MFFIILALLTFPVFGLTAAMDVLKVDKTMIDVRIILDVVAASDGPKGLNVSYINRTLDKALEIFQLPEYNKDLPVIIFIHGFHATVEKFYPHFNVLLQKGSRKSYNLLALNMPTFFQLSRENLYYFLPVTRAKFGGEAVGELLNEVIDLGLLSPENIHFIGYSLGAQMAGYIARTVRGQVDSILGLDPAGPGFDPVVVNYNLMMTHVNKDDARVVHMYHTNSNAFGSAQRVATADITFNNGWYQPGCATNLICSHKRSLYLLVQILDNPSLFMARHCSTYREFFSCMCREHEALELIYPLDSRFTGTYFLTTSFEPAFGEGQLGSMCAKDRLKKLRDEGLIKPQPSFYERIKMIGESKWRSKIITNTRDTSGTSRTSETLREETDAKTEDVVDSKNVNGVDFIDSIQSRRALNPNANSGSLPSTMTTDFVPVKTDRKSANVAYSKDVKGGEFVESLPSRKIPYANVNSQSLSSNPAGSSSSLLLVEDVPGRTDGLTVDVDSKDVSGTDVMDSFRSRRILNPNVNSQTLSSSRTTESVPRGPDDRFAEVADHSDDSGRDIVNSTTLPEGTSVNNQQSQPQRQFNWFW